MKTITWNSQGYKPEQIDNLLQLGFDVICIQEAGNGPGFAQFRWDSINERLIILTEYNGYHCIQWENDLGQNSRCSIVMFIKPELVQDGFEIKICNYDMRMRPLIGLIFNDKFISTTHCPAFNSNFAQKVRNYFAQEIINSLYVKDWQMVGDFNCDSRYFQQIPQGAKIVSQLKETQKNGGILDYMVKKDSGADFGVEVGEYMSDHRVIFFT